MNLTLIQEKEANVIAEPTAPLPQNTRPRAKREDTASEKRGLVVSHSVPAGRS